MMCKNKKLNHGFTRTPKFDVTPKGGGFTLIETLVAVSIFSVSILSLMAVLAQGISDTNYEKKRIIAAYLAQEGIEYMRNLRDTFMLYGDGSPPNWTQFRNAINECGTPGISKFCYFDDQDLDFEDPDMPVTQISIQSCGNNPCLTPLRYNSNTGKYNYDIFGADSGFIRSIQATYPGDPDYDIKISSTVSWTQGSGGYNITFSERLFNWE